MIPVEGVEPRVIVYHERVEFIGSSKSNNISILLWNITFEDEGEYTCFARNPKEKGRNHSAIYTLIVVDQSMWRIHTIEYTWLKKIHPLQHLVSDYDLREKRTHDICFTLVKGAMCKIWTIVKFILHSVWVYPQRYDKKLRHPEGTCIRAFPLP